MRQIWKTITDTLRTVKISTLTIVPMFQCEVYTRVQKYFSEYSLIETKTLLRLNQQKPIYLFQTPRYSFQVLQILLQSKILYTAPSVLIVH